jgi:peptidoglycan/xylan/chitin deacetylase (PgdA/CDA1 family)
MIAGSRAQTGSYDVNMDGALIGVAAGVASVGAMTYAVRARSSPFFGESYYRGNRSIPRLALTFDDGPSRSTPALLEVLAEQKVPATFFMCGRNVRRHAGIALEVKNAGHELGNHSDSHPYLYFKSPEFIFKELSLTQESIQAAAGVVPVWFRAPYGVRWFGVGRAQRRLGLKGVMWTLLARDWRWPADRVTHFLVQRACNGAIICLHDGRGLRSAPDIRATIAGVEAAIPRLKERGFEFVTLSEILCPTN